MKALVTGGASCGKSAFAETLCQRLGGPLVYLAAMQPFGEEAQRRIRRHRELRSGKGFSTLECHEGLDAAIAADLSGRTVLLECLGNVVANSLFGEGQPDCSSGHLQTLRTQTAQQLHQLAESCANLVVVGNEVGLDGVRYATETEAYQQLLADVSRDWAGTCDSVVLVTAGIPQVLKDNRCNRHLVAALASEAKGERL